jgi:hypothetical protein
MSLIVSKILKKFIYLNEVAVSEGKTLVSPLNIQKPINTHFLTSELFNTLVNSIYF